MSLAKVLQEDYRLLHHMCHISNDFVEGIRAKLIEKDNNARWKPAKVDEVVAFPLLMLSGRIVCSSTGSELHGTNSMYGMLSSRTYGRGQHHCITKRVVCVVQNVAGANNVGLQVTDEMVNAYFRRLKPSEELQLEETTQHLHSRL